MKEFWSEHTASEITKDGIALTLPLMYPDGWQVSIFISSPTPRRIKISDHGQTLGRLVESGMNLKAKNVQQILDDRLGIFELQRDGLVITKDATFPVQGIDIQLFAEAIVSIAHLIYRHEPSTSVEGEADKALIQIFKAKKISPKKNAELEGFFERSIYVNYLVEAKKRLAIKVVHRRNELLPYMEQWAFRWQDIGRTNIGLIKAMVYDPEQQEWDNTALQIGHGVCDIFCPYYETGQLQEALDESFLTTFDASASGVIPLPSLRAGQSPFSAH